MHDSFVIIHEFLYSFIKQVSLNSLDKKKSYETILWENDILKFLQKSFHPNIVKTYDIYRNQDFFFFIIEYIPSGNLKNYLLENRSKLSFKELKTIMFQIASAVMFIHSHGIVHRDLKAENILILIQDNFRRMVTDLSWRDTIRGIVWFCGKGRSTLSEVVFKEESTVIFHIRKDPF